MRKTLALLLLIAVAAPVFAANRAVAATALPWSDPATWGGHLPTADEVVTIPTGKTVLLDVNPPPLGGVRIDGALVFAEQDLALESEWIVVAGLLQVGTADAPFAHRATVTLTDRIPGEEIDGMGDKVLGVIGGALELHGEDRGPSWTRLIETVEAGSSELVLEMPVEWRPGDRLVLASTDFDPYQAEEVGIAVVTGNVVTLDAPLAFSHWGEDQTYGAYTLNERAEVGLLSRNVVIQGDEGSETDGFGGHLMVMGGTAHIEDIEVTRMGQAAHLARYPIHFHLLGDRPDAYVRDSAIHHTYNRCLTLHGTNGVAVTGNVAYDALGHCFFLEDGIETGNRLENNLGILTRTPADAQRILPSDELPATFWLTNPDNIVRGNVAAGSDAFGFWYALPEHPLGLSQAPANDRAVWPRRTPLREFTGNVAHSNGFRGLNVDDGPMPDGTTEVTFYDPHTNRIPPGDDESDSPVATATFTDFTAYKNRERGVWLRGANELLTGAVLADNLIGATFASIDTFVEESLFVGESANAGTPAEWEETGLDGRSLPQPWDASFPIRGYEFYDGVVGARNVAFTGFHANAQRPASGLGFLRRDEFPLDPHNAVADLIWLDDSNRVYIDAPIPAADGEKTALFHDVTGSVTGHPGAVVTAAQPFLADPTCRAEPAWNAAVCLTSYGALSLESVAPGPVLVGPVTLRRADGVGLWLTGTPGDEGAPRTYFQASLIPNAAYTAQFVAVPWQLRLAFTGQQSGDWIQLAIPYPYSAGEPHVYPGYDPSDERALPRVARLAELADAEGAARFFDGEILTVKLAVPEGEESIVVDVCRREGCG